MFRESCPFYYCTQEGYAGHRGVRARGLRRCARSRRYSRRRNGTSRAARVVTRADPKDASIGRTHSPYLKADDPRPLYLFHPATVEKRIAGLPRVGELVHSKMRRGEPSAAFPELEKTKREILRILGRAEGYPHLDTLLRTLEWCLERGWDAHQLGARDRGEFASLMSDLAVAEHALLRGFSISSTVRVAGSGRKPDLYLTGKTGEAAVEVFRPRELERFHAFEEDATRLFSEADIRLDYEVEINLRLVSDFDEDGRLISPPHPIALDEALGLVGDELVERLAARLSPVSPAAEVRLDEEWPDANLRVECELRRVALSSEQEPRRRIVVGKSFGGYEPVGMLRRLMKPIIGKAKERQAGARNATARVLICDVSDSVVAPHLDEQVRAEGFTAVLAEELVPRVEHDYDAIALCQRLGFGRGLRTNWVVCASADYDDIADELLGPLATRWKSPEERSIASCGN